MADFSLDFNGLDFDVDTGYVSKIYTGELAICRRWLRAQAVRVNTSANPTCMTIDMAAVPSISGGGQASTAPVLTKIPLFAIKQQPHCKPL
ncbi:MAG TPA: hypothetical protein PKL28_07320 [Rhodocyclaceae bacterium]|nr:hypothetical protein [Rhodocyclaceae bacterium]